MIIKELLENIKQQYPVQWQENYDNSGLLVGDVSQEIHGVLISLDCTEAVLNEAIEKNCNVIISHHPIIFNGLKNITQHTKTGKILTQAIKNDIAIIAFHTNIDNHIDGFNKIFAEALGLKNVKTLQPKGSLLGKLVTFVPVSYAEEVRESLFSAGAGQIGAYDACSFNTIGKGTFRASESSNPFVGKKGEIHFEEEYKIEVIFPLILKNKIMKALLAAHPYEEVAFDIYKLENEFTKIGPGIIGSLESDCETTEFLRKLKNITGGKVLKHSKIFNNRVKKVALCGGSGSFLIPEAISQNADVFITAEIKYHHYIDYVEDLLLIDAGHYETEQFIKEMLKAYISKNFSNFVVSISQKEKNPVEYYI